MRFIKWISLLAAATLIGSCFVSWVFIESRNISVSGVSAEGTNFGKPGYFHLLLTIIYIVFTLLPRVWAKRMNFIIAALNTAWAIRNFIIISACAGGECPEKKTGLYLMLASSIVMLIAALFPDIELKQETKK